MLFKNVESERHLWMQYGVTLAVMAIIVIAVTVSLMNSFVTSVRESTMQTLEATNRRDASAVDGFLDRGESVLLTTSRMVDDLMRHGASMAQIESLLVGEYEYFHKGEYPEFCNLLGVFQGKFFSGGKWTPAVGYIPSRRPWFQEAFRARGKVAFVPTHINPRDNERVISVSRRLSDQKSVIALDLYLKDIQERISPWKYSKTWMVLDKNGVVVMHSNVMQLGRNYLSSEFWGYDEEKLAREVLMANGESVLFRFNGKEYQVLSYLMKDRWYMVRLVDDDMLWSDMYMVVARNIVIAVLLYALFAMVITFIFMRHLKTHRLSYAKSGFLVNMSREIKTAMTDMLGLSSIVMKEVRGDTLKDYVKNIQNAGEGVLSLVSDVLDVSKIESGKMSLVSMEYDVFAVLSDCYSENFPKASAKNLRFTLECNPDIPTSMWGDETRIRQILNNLLSNAIKFTEVGEVSLSVGFEHLPPIGNLKSDDYVMLKFIVKDTGVGISDDELDSIFSRYIPKAKKYEEQIEGAGIGLSLTKALVEKCGGQISVSSRVGEGSAFVVKIPQLVMNMDPIGDFSLKYRTASRKNDDLSELFIAPDARVLIVDDMEINLKVLRGFLKGSKVQVDVALSGMQCLKLVQSKRYDLIFLDQRMPVMDGMETYRKMKALGDYANKDTPVVVLTSEGSVKSRESFLSEGFADYLPKPIRERDLLRALKWYLPKQLVLGSDDLDYASSESGKQFDGIVDEDTIEDGGIELHSVTTLNPYEKMEPFRDILDVKAGLEYCADDSGIYLEMLQEYVQSTLSRSVDISFKNDDWDNYRFYMHVLSDASSAIGAVSMAKQFSDLEMACRESRMNFVRANHELAMITHTELIFNIQKGLEK